MDLHNLERSPGSKRPMKRIGRGNGSGHGTTATRGSKGQKARSGGKIRRGFEGGQMPLYRRIPKRGFKNVSRKVFTVINLSDLERNFEQGSVITPEILLSQNVIKKLLNGVKILGEGELTKALTVKAHRFSKSAVEKILKTGGTIEELK
jgi:large subunit ribosomal protein L15